MFYNLQLGRYTVQSNTRAPLRAPDISVPRVIQGHKNIFMGASGYWATEMFAIFSVLHDSIRASRLILRAPTVSPSIRNMYNSAACFFFPSPFFFRIYICAITRPQQPRHPKKRKKKTKKKLACCSVVERYEGSCEMANVGQFMQPFFFFHFHVTGLVKK